MIAFGNESYWPITQCIKPSRCLHLDDDVVAQFSALDNGSGSGEFCLIRN